MWFSHTQIKINKNLKEKLDCLCCWQFFTILDIIICKYSLSTYIVPSLYHIFKCFGFLIFVFILRIILIILLSLCAWVQVCVRHGVRVEAKGQLLQLILLLCVVRIQFRLSALQVKRFLPGKPSFWPRLSVLMTFFLSVLTFAVHILVV